MTMRHNDDTTHRPHDAGDDEPLDGWLQALAADYHRPPAPPRELMWSRIQAARGAGGAEGAAAATDADVPMPAAPVLTVESTTARPGRRGGAGGDRWTRGLIALAATLLLGVALGRFVGGRGDASAPSVAGAPAQVAAIPTVPAPPAMPRPEDRPVVLTPPPADAAGAGTTRGGSAGEAGVRTPAPRPAVAGPPRTLAAAPRPGVPDPATLDRGASLDGTLQVAAVQHLGEVEFLLTSFRLEPQVADVLPTLQPWARELLMTTRLMLDSPVGRDARYGRLLGDLEMVLTQIAQLPAARAAEERQLITRSLERNDLMTQLRTAVPAGPARPQRSGE